MTAPHWAQEGVPLVLFLFVVVFFRAQGTYWLARSVPEIVARKANDSTPRLKKLACWLEGPGPRMGANILEKWGIIAIPLSFLTVGIQTAVLAAAGLLRVRWSLFTVAMLPGAVAWALLYGYGMLAVWTAAVMAVAGNPWAWGALGLVALGIWAIVRRRRARQPRPQNGAADC